MLRTHRTPTGFIEPCLPTPADYPPSGPGWIHEIKHDGFRLMVRRDAFARVSAHVETLIGARGGSRSDSAAGLRKA